ncbi:S-adenosylmethionine--tRNA ribosyltransferase-isomerase [Agrobacterium rubi TR3 = NBRC 13261]|uniref:S-adenosylmethionine:tRNA ribosyltransferase-isomerase n=1 Tax=Agrobacterium rubi TR3 = NBRC 13261 TaxID=1368415 RepID=A0A081CWF5_9HYPH|nr:tRNA preQ1(34) S-adenosylmethionine ribosyltransferase-isomerase QueA [Agrobacterium rubi]MBP1877963.1 S-adenosylmethionine:tRNA ribosyltransferase-isomerase [Agrobacterium rubi]MCL6651852.1 tRNA preQ1(34) S-adenosylmethionine ribosyltransferase-isomerase QueA [Agrobacterium rubi]GAK71001.1 S-adenosylmethionine--tRNA ribosyltransferase-isomerase [Agrobacterium rubi TR3 = NBRC 13261]
MRVDLFDFDLPDDNIALRPASPRDSARLLVVDPNANSMTDHNVFDLPSFLKPGDALVFNDTRVIPAQLEGVRLREGAPETAVSATLHMRADASRWKAFARPGKRIKQGDRIRFGYERDNACGLAFLEATVEEKGEEGEITLLFDVSGPVLDEAIASVGHIPLPPYIAAKRPEDAQDQTDYQTIYAREKGAVAAPTAGLHFTPALFEALDAAGIERHFVTLHVGAGTFLPVKADDTEEHKMHFEIGTVSEETAAKLNAVKARGGRIVCVGTTSLRLIESAARDDGQIAPWSGATGIFITPGYRFKAVDILMTNFHLPKSTLFMLVSAFCGLETMREAYRHAIETGYRFYSYGDSSLLFRKT